MKVLKKLVLEDEEADIFEHALIYIKHRLKVHGTQGAQSVCTLEMCEKLLREIKEIKVNEN